MFLSTWKFLLAHVQLKFITLRDHYLFRFSLSLFLVFKLHEDRQCISWVGQGEKRCPMPEI